ncbi:MAG: VWA domain-containing protein [Magnetococcales bacterium]|nr:VWA domain-containing protein [Magnetococcales bacterium]
MPFARSNESLAMDPATATESTASSSSRMVPMAPTSTVAALASPSAEPPPVSGGKADDSVGRVAQPVLKAKKMPVAHAAVPQSSRVDALHLPTPVVESETRDRFPESALNPVYQVAERPVSTFSADVDTASYSFVRRALNRGHLPSPDAVRVEEMINYFHYDYRKPTDAETPFTPTLALFPTPWNSNTHLLQIGIQGYEPSVESRPRSNLVFLLDVSGSMRSRDKLPLLKKSLRLLIGSLHPEDHVAIVVYAGAAGAVLEPTPVRERQRILSALDNLRAGGSTAGGAGIELAYRLAEQNFSKDAVNRIILATDGDFNVGVSNPRALKQLIARKRQSGVFLSVLGFGQGNYNDRLMQTLAQNGNGTAAYIDTLNEARKLLVDEAAATLIPIAKDVKYQIEFNPDRVAEYRLIGYETRKLAREDFNNDAVDAGEIGSGHTVTALYEITLTESENRFVDPLRYGTASPREMNERDGGGNRELAFLKMRFKQPDGSRSRLITRAITDADRIDLEASGHEDQRFAAAVAALGQKLQQSSHLHGFSTQRILDLALSGKGEDPFGYRAEFTALVRMVQALERR